MAEVIHQPKRIRPKRRPSPQRTPEEIEYFRRVSRNKAKAARKRAAKRWRAEIRAVKEMHRERRLAAMVPSRPLAPPLPEKEIARQASRDERERAMARRCNALRRAAKRHATPAWASKQRIHEICVAAVNLEERTGMAWHVDHIVPLISPIVCGLHCEFNLEPVPATDNLEKSNRRWPDMP